MKLLCLLFGHKEDIRFYSRGCTIHEPGDKKIYESTMRLRESHCSRCGQILWIEPRGIVGKPTPPKKEEK